MSIEERLSQYIKELFSSDASGHDYFHSLRVYRTAMRLAESVECDRDIVMMSALLHDADDAKLFDSADYGNARAALAKCGVSSADIERVVGIIKAISFKGADTVVPDSIEGKIVQDADRLDAIGAIGIARTFAFGGSRGRTMHDPDQPPKPNMSKEEYARSKGTTINHFYEKLLLVGSMMNTDEAKRMAAGREKYMRGFLEEFFEEWDGGR